jgi:tetratricopeptide (TPR) repeat protein
MGNYEKATAMFKTYRELLKKQTETEPGFDELAWYYYRLGKVDKALEVIRLETDPLWKPYMEMLILYSEGYRGEADELLEDFINIPEQVVLENGVSMDVKYYMLAEIFALKGDKENAFDYLFKSYEILLVFTETLWNSSKLRNLQNDARWQVLLDRLGEDFNFDYNRT